MDTLTPYQRSFDNLIHTIREVEDLSFFHYSVDVEHQLAIVDVMHVHIEDAVDVVTAAFTRIAVESKAMVEQIAYIVRDVLENRRGQMDGFIKAAKTDLASAALIRAPYAEACLDVRIAIALKEDSLAFARDYIHYELGITALKQYPITPEERLSCLKSPLS